MKCISILIADDEEEIADAIHLEKEGYNVIKVHDGQEAIQVIQIRRCTSITIFSNRALSMNKDKHPFSILGAYS
jgi:CheY-like chemotaxis protein